MRPRSMLRRILIGGLALGLAGTAVAGEVFTSGPQRVALLELFTSEGCSSCPPAEEWLGERREVPGLWTEFVPVAFHVNYWDRLGWPDQFAKRGFTDRQYAYARSWGARSVYTPGFVRNGREWRRDPSNETAAKTGILTMEHLRGAKWRVSFAPAGRARTFGYFEIQIAVLGGGIASPVSRGENAGKILHHEFVALKLQGAELASAGKGRFATDVEIEVPEVEGVTRFAIAAWVVADGRMEPLQAIGGWLK